MGFGTGFATGFAQSINQSLTLADQKRVEQFGLEFDFMAKVTMNEITTENAERKKIRDMFTGLVGKGADRRVALEVARTAVASGQSFESALADAMTGSADNLPAFATDEEAFASSGLNDISVADAGAKMMKIRNQKSDFITEFGHLYSEEEKATFRETGGSSNLRFSPLSGDRKGGGTPAPASPFDEPAQAPQKQQGTDPATGRPIGAPPGPPGLPKKTSQAGASFGPSSGGGFASKAGQPQTRTNTGNAESGGVNPTNVANRRTGKSFTRNGVTFTEPAPTFRASAELRKMASEFLQANRVQGDQDQALFFKFIGSDTATTGFGVTQEEMSRVLSLMATFDNGESIAGLPDEALGKYIKSLGLLPEGTQITNELIAQYREGGITEILPDRAIIANPSQMFADNMKLVQSAFNMSDETLAEIQKAALNPNSNEDFFALYTKTIGVQNERQIQGAFVLTRMQQIRSSSVDAQGRSNISAEEAFAIAQGDLAIFEGQYNKRFAAAQKKTGALGADQFADWVIALEKKGNAAGAGFILSKLRREGEAFSDVKEEATSAARGLSDAGKKAPVKTSSSVGFEQEILEAYANIRTFEESNSLSEPARKAWNGLLNGTLEFDLIEDDEVKQELIDFNNRLIDIGITERREQ